MAQNDNSQLKLDQLTEAVKGLYAKSSMSQGEIYNALTSLSQRYENISNVTGEKIAATIVSEFRKTIDVNYNDTTRQLKDLEAHLKNFLTVDKEDFAKDLKDFIENISSLYQKIESEHKEFSQIASKIEKLNGDDVIFEITKLSDNFHSFSKGFDNITSTLNKNFADFLEQIRRFNSKDEINAMKAEILSMTNNLNGAVKSIQAIDSKYVSMTGLIEKITTKESEFSTAIAEFRSLQDLINSIKDDISNINTKEDFENFGYEIKEKIESLKNEIKKSGFSDATNEIQNSTDAFLTKEIAVISDDIRNLWANFTDTKGEMSVVKNSLSSVDMELKEVKSILNNRLPSVLGDSANEMYLEKTKEELKGLIQSLSSFKDDIVAINQGNIEILQAPIEKAIEGLKNQDLGRNISELSSNLNKVTSEVQQSIQNLQKTLTGLNNVSSVQLLTQISEAIPAIVDRLDIYKNQMANEGSLNLTNIKGTMAEIITSIQDALKNTVEKIGQDTKNISLETITTVKVDLQRLSDSIEDNVQNLNDELKRDFMGFKSDFRDLSVKQITGIEKIQDKLLVIESILKNYNGIPKSDSPYKSSSLDLDILSSFKSDVLEVILNSDRVSKTAFSCVEGKIDKILINLMGNMDTISKKPFNQALFEIDNKIEKTNLQQIHNAKELLEEIQSGNNILTTKLTNLEENGQIDSIYDLITKIQERLNEFDKSNDEITDGFNEFKEQVSQKLKENVQKISALVQNPDTDKSESQNATVEALVGKVQEYISNFEYLKGHISQELKENLKNEFSKVQASIRNLRTTDENSNYTYTLEDVESDLAKIRLIIEKSTGSTDNFKNLFEKLVELRTVGLENVKINRDVETELGQISSWFKDTVDKLDDMQERLYDIQNTGFEDIKTRLIQSEKSKNATNEFSAKVESALKHLIKNTQMQENKITELTKKLEAMQEVQNDSFNPAQFIDIFYENMTQTKMLTNRVEIMEDKINSIQNAVNKLLSYVEN